MSFTINPGLLDDAVYEVRANLRSLFYSPVILEKILADILLVHCARVIVKPAGYEGAEAFNISFLKLFRRIDKFLTQSDMMIDMTMMSDLRLATDSPLRQNFYSAFNFNLETFANFMVSALKIQNSLDSKGFLTAQVWFVNFLKISGVDSYSLSFSSGSHIWPLCYFEKNEPF